MGRKSLRSQQVAGTYYNCLGKIETKRGDRKGASSKETK